MISAKGSCINKKIKKYMREHNKQYKQNKQKYRQTNEETQVNRIILE